MNLQQIKDALKNGDRVYWCNTANEVIQDKTGQYLIVHKWTGYAIGLTWADNVTMNGDESDFFCIKQPEQVTV